jgi:hypothetical protein
VNFSHIPKFGILGHDILLMKQIGGAVVVHHLVPGRSTAGQSCYDLPLHCVLVCEDRIIRDDDITDKIWE